MIGCITRRGSATLKSPSMQLTNATKSYGAGIRKQSTKVRKQSSLAFVAPSVELSHKSLNLFWPDGINYQLDPHWLRERCQNAASVDLATKQPLLNPHDLPDNMAVTDAKLVKDDTVVEVKFNDGHASHFTVDRLRAELTDFRNSPLQVEDYERPGHRLWSGDEYVCPEYSYAELAESEAKRFALTTDLLVDGAVLVRGVPQESGAVCGFGQMLSTLRETDWGPSFNVRTKPDDSQNKAGGVKRDLAYTPKPIGFHTDNPYRWPTPDFQLLHAIDHCTCPDQAPCAECSVMNYMVDGFYIAEKIRQEDPEAFKLLSTIPVRFENDGGDGGSALVHVAPHFEIEQTDAASSETPRLQAIRFSAKSGQYAPALEPEVASAFYHARRRFSELAHEAKHISSMQFKPGDCVVFDNQRILHARSEIMPTDGERWVQGCYIDRDGLWLNYERSRRKLTIP